MKIVSGVPLSNAWSVSRAIEPSQGGSRRDPGRQVLSEDASLRGVVAGISAAAIILTFVILGVVSPRFEVTRSDQPRGAIEVSVPEATTRAFLAMASAEACADANGIGRASGFRPRISILEGVSYATVSAWREGCGGMTLSIPLRDGLTQAAVRRALSAFQAGVVAVEQGRTQAALDAAAAFHEAARQNGVGYRLVGYALR